MSRELEAILVQGDEAKKVVDALTQTALTPGDELDLEDILQVGSTVFRHPVFSDMYVVLGNNEYGFLVFTGDEPKAYPAYDMGFEECDDKNPPKFLEVELQPEKVEDVSERSRPYYPNGRVYWTYPEDEMHWYCYEEDYTGTFKAGDTVYPIVFIGNVPGGWTVRNKEGKEEYWQCE